MCSRSYWNTKLPFYNESFSAIMSGRRFERLMKFFHFNDVEKQPNRTSHDCDKIYKLRPFLDLVVKAFQSVYIPSQELSVDESIIDYKGRLLWIQYIPLKNQAWVLADAIKWLCVQFQVIYR